MASSPQDFLLSKHTNFGCEGDLEEYNTPAARFFHIQKGERAQLRECDPLSLSHARAQGLPISPGPACASGVLKSSEDLLMKPAGATLFDLALQVAQAEAGGSRRKSGGNPPCLPTPLRASAGCSSRGAEDSEPASDGRTPLPFSPRRRRGKSISFLFPRDFFSFDV